MNSRRLFLISVFAVADVAATASGCDKAVAPASTKGSAEVTKPTTTPVAVEKMAPPDASAERVSPAGALDFELVEKVGSYTLRDKAYEATFQSTPKVQPQDQSTAGGIKLHGLMAIASIGETEAYGLIVLPIPRNVPYDIPKGLHEARDGMFKAMGATMTSDKDFDVGGLAGRQAIGKASLQGNDMRIEVRLAFDKPHNTMVGLMALTKSENLDAEVGGFLKSFAVKPGDAPPAGDGTK